VFLQGILQKWDVFAAKRRQQVPLGMTTRKHMHQQIPPLRCGMTTKNRQLGRKDYSRFPWGMTQETHMQGQQQIPPLRYGMTTKKTGNRGGMTTKKKATEAE